MGILGFGKSGNGSDSIDIDDDELEIEPAHPNFTAHFADPIYEDCSSEFSPFGSDEGAETLATWTERRDVLSATTTVRQMFLADQEDFWNGAMAEVKGEPGYEGSVDGATWLVSYAFALLRLTGHIDREGQELGVAALDRLIDYYGDEDEELQIQRHDLATWINPST